MENYKTECVGVAGDFSLPVLQNIAEAIKNMDIADPAQKIDLAGELAKLAANILEQTASTASLSSDYEYDEEGSGSDPCDTISPVDLASANQPGVMEYDTAITGSEANAADGRVG